MAAEDRGLSEMNERSGEELVGFLGRQAEIKEARVLQDRGARVRRDAHGKKMGQGWDQDDANGD